MGRQANLKSKRALFVGVMRTYGFCEQVGPAPSLQVEYTKDACSHKHGQGCLVPWRSNMICAWSHSSWFKISGKRFGSAPTLVRPIKICLQHCFDQCSCVNSIFLAMLGLHMIASPQTEFVYTVVNASLDMPTRFRNSNVL